MWNLSNKAETSAMIKSSCNKTSNLTADDLSPAGTWFVNMMKKAGLGNEGWVAPEAGDGSDAGSTPAGPSAKPPAPGGNTTPTGPGANADQTTEVPTVDDLFEKIDKAEVTISNSWPTENGYGIQLNVVIKNTGAKEETNWTRKLKLKPGTKLTVSQSWCAQVTMDKKDLVIQPEEYNKTIPAGGEVSGIGIIIEVE
jgi:endoglucanase